MIGRLMHHLRNMAGNADIRPKAFGSKLAESGQMAAKPDPMIEVDKALAQESPRPEPAPLPPVTHPAFDAKAFFAVLRGGQLRHRETEQVEGTEMLLSKLRGLRTSWVAYALATTWHETGATMQPVRENLNYSVKGLLTSFSRTRISRADAERLGRKQGEGRLSPSRQAAIANTIYGGPWGRQNLGNTLPGDGSLFLGRGYVQITGRTNYERAAAATGYPLVGNPDLTMRPDIAAEILRSGMVDGWFVPGHNLARYLPDAIGTREQFEQARRIINGMDKAALIADYAVDFQAALIAGGWK